MNNNSENFHWRLQSLLVGLLVVMCFVVISMGIFISRQQAKKMEPSALSRLETAVAQARKDSEVLAGQALAKAEKATQAAVAAVAVAEKEKTELLKLLEAMKTENAILSKSRQEMETKLLAAEKEVATWHEQETVRLQAQAAKREQLRLTAEARRLAMEAKTRIVDLGGDVVMPFMRCPAGSFLMGSPVGEAGRNSDEDQHEVTVTRPFWMGKFEVTQAQWMALMPKNLSTIKGSDLPVDTVSWHEATAFCQKLTERERLAGRLQLEYEYRLPTEAEWEYACRAGSSTAYAGTGNSNDMGWYDANSNKKPQPVGRKQPNAWGLYDMHGNVWEWCGDWKKEYPVGASADPKGPPTGADRVFRGGSWFTQAATCRAAARDCGFPSYRLGIVGFRVVLAPLVQP